MPRVGRSEFWSLAILAALTLVAFAVRLQGLARGLWLDEHVTAWVIRDGYAPIWERSWINNNSPPYFLIVRWSADLWEYTEAGLRIPSLIAGTLLVPAAYLLARRLCVPRPLAVMASGLVAFDSNCIFYALEARPYALVQLLSALQICAYLDLLDDRAVRSRAQRWLCSLLSGGLLAAAVYLHPLAVLLAIPEVVYLVIQSVRERRDPAKLQRAAAAFAGMGLAGGLCLPLASHLRYLNGAKGVLGSWVGDQPFYHPLTLFNGTYYVYIPFAIALVVDSLIARGRRTEAAAREQSPAAEPSRRWERALFPCLWLYVPAWTAWGLTATNVARIYVTRYLAFAAVAPIMLAMTCCASLRTSCARLVAVGVMMGLLHFSGERCLVRAINGSLRHFHGTDRWCDAREIVACINAEWNDSRPVLVDSGLAERKWLTSAASDPLREYLLSPVNSLSPIKPAPSDSTGVIPIDLDEPATVAPYLDAILSTGGFLLATPNEVSEEKVRSLVAALVKERGVKEAAYEIEFERPHRHVLGVRMKY